MVAGEIADGQQEEQHGQGAENHLRGAVVLQGADEHEQGEDAPEQQIEGQRQGVTLETAFGKGVDPDQHQRPPEQTVGREGGAGEGVAVAQFKDAGDDLCQTAHGDTHGDGDDRQGQQTAVVQIQQDSGHAKAQQTQRAGIGVFRCSRHGLFSS